MVIDSSVVTHTAKQWETNNQWIGGIHVHSVTISLPTLYYRTVRDAWSWSGRFHSRVIGDNIFCTVTKPKTQTWVGDFAATVHLHNFAMYRLHLLHLPGTGRFCTGKMSPTETLRRISSREGQNTKPLLVLSTSESRHQYVEPVQIVVISHNVTWLYIYM